MVECSNTRTTCWPPRSCPHLTRPPTPCKGVRCSTGTITRKSPRSCRHLARVFFSWAECSDAEPEQPCAVHPFRPTSTGPFLHSSKPAGVPDATTKPSKLSAALSALLPVSESWQSRSASSVKPARLCCALSAGNAAIPELLQPSPLSSDFD